MQVKALAAIAAEVAATDADRRGQLLKPMADLLFAPASERGDFDVEIYTDLAIELLARASVFERIGFAGAVADSGWKLARLTQHLLADMPMIARVVVERGRLSEGDLGRLLDGSGDKDGGILTAIAGRAGLPASISDRLIAGERGDVLLAVAANKGARISADGFDRLTRVAVHREEMDRTLARRDDLPEAIARLLTRRLTMINERRLAAMLTRDLGKGRRDFVLRDGRDR